MLDHEVRRSSEAWRAAAAYRVRRGLPPDHPEVLAHRRAYFAARINELLDLADAEAPLNLDQLAELEARLQRSYPAIYLGGSYVTAAA